jgi:hypothetical protein
LNRTIAARWRAWFAQQIAKLSRYLSARAQFMAFQRVLAGLLAVAGALALTATCGFRKPHTRAYR